MGSIVNGITGLFSGGKSNPNSSAGSIAGLDQNSFLQQQLAGEQNALSGVDQALGNQLVGQGTDIFGPAFGQYNAGISGQLTPAQQSLVTQNLGAMDATTRGEYGGLGLGGSTMEGQDLASNALKSMAENANLSFQNETSGLAGLQEALGYYGGATSARSAAEGALGGAGSSLSGASSSLADAGQLQNQNTAQLNAAINSLGNKSAGGLGSGIQSLLGGGAGGAAGAGAAAGTGIAAGDLAAGTAGAGGTAAALGASPAIADILPALLFA